MSFLCVAKSNQKLTDDGVEKRRNMSDLQSD